MFNDLRFAIRMLGKNPGFTIVAMLTLALGIGACTVIFSVVNHVLLLPLAYPQSERLVVLRETKLPQFPEFAVAPANYIDWRAQATGFEQLVAIRPATYNLTGRGEPVRVAADRVTPNYLTTFRMQPLIGRDFAEAEVTAQANVAILTHGFWLRQFGGRPEIVGETVQLDGQPFAIIGILPVSFQPDTSAEVYTPLRYNEDSQKRGSKGLRVIGRLKKNIPLETARKELDVIASRLENEYPDSNTGWRVKVTPMLESMVTNVRPALLSFLGGVGFLLLISCANVANLLLARASTRSKEIAVRATLGATRSRIVVQLLTESVVLGCLAGVIGLLLSMIGVKTFQAFAPVELPRLGEIGIDRRAFCVSLTLSLLTGIFFGLVPAFHAARANFNATLKSAGRGVSGDRSRQRLREVLGIGEIAMALAMLVGAGLLFRSFTHLLSVNPGFQSGDTIAINLSLPEKKYSTDPQQAAFAEQAVAKLQTLLGKKSVAVANMLPLSSYDLTYAFALPGMHAPESATVQSALFYSVSPDYFQVLQISIRRGRTFTTADRAGAPLVAIINDSMARRFFPGQDPIGQRISLASGDSEIVGIVADVKHNRLDEDAGAQTYVPFQQVPFLSMSFVMHGTDRISGLAPAIRAEIASIDKSQPIASIRPLTELLGASVARQRFAMFLFGTFSTMALVLATIGLYGVMAYSVTQRTAEIGLRMALGAQRSDVLRLILRQGGKLVTLGLICGILVALLLTRSISAMLFGVSSYDLFTYVSISVLLTAVAAVACLIPARRAMNVDPMEGLRYE